MVYLVFSIVGFLALLCIVVMYHLYMVERIAYDTVTLSMAHGRISALETFLYVILIFLTSAISGQVSGDSHARWVMNILSLLASSLVGYLYIVYQPYYNLLVQTLKVASTAYLAWSCLAVVLLEAIPSTGYECKYTNIHFY